MMFFFPLDHDISTLSTDAMTTSEELGVLHLFFQTDWTFAKKCVKHTYWLAGLSAGWAFENHRAKSVKLTCQNELHVNLSQNGCGTKPKII
jgi:hypothetical protein